MYSGPISFIGREQLGHFD